jgi:hypothetical protein
MQALFPKKSAATRFPNLNDRKNAKIANSLIYE